MMIDRLLNKTGNSVVNVTDYSNPFVVDSGYVEYEESLGTSLMKRMPRFGHEKDFVSAALANDSDYAFGEYRQGILFAFLIILVPMVVWTLVLMVLKVCCPYDKVGFLSGAPFLTPRDCDKDEFKNWKHRVFLTRIVFWLCGGILVTLSILMFTEGYHHIEASKDILSQTNQEIRVLLREATVVTSNMIGMESQLKLAQDNDFFRLPHVQSICPANPGALINFMSGMPETFKDENAFTTFLAMRSRRNPRFLQQPDNETPVTFQSPNTVEETDDNPKQKQQKEQSPHTPEPLAELEEQLPGGETPMLRDVVELWYVMRNVETYLNEALGNHMDNLRQTLHHAHNYTEVFDDMINRMDDAEYWLGTLAACLVVIAAVMIVSAIIAHGACMNPCCSIVLDWWFLPIFILVIIVSYVLCSFTAILAVSNADFCSGSGVAGSPQTPESSVLLTMEYSGFAKTDFEYQTIRYYSHQCSNKSQVDPFLFLRDYWVEMSESQAMLAELRETVNKNSIQDLSQFCDRDFQSLTSALDVTETIVDQLKTSTENTIDIIDCNRIVPIYTSTTYGAICHHSMIGISWLYFCLLFISIAGMIMITCRSSYQNSIVERKDLLTKNELKHDLELSTSFSNDPVIEISTGGGGGERSFTSSGDSSGVAARTGSSIIQMLTGRRSDTGDKDSSRDKSKRRKRRGESSRRKKSKDGSSSSSSRRKKDKDGKRKKRSSAAVNVIHE